MSRETDRLVADRGHGLSRPQREALRWLETQGLDGAAPRRAATWDALERLGLVEHHPGVGEWFGRALTADGQTLAGRMFRMPARGEQR